MGIFGNSSYHDMKMTNVTNVTKDSYKPLIVTQYNLNG